MNIRRAGIQSGGVLFILPDILFRDFLGGNPLLIGALDNLIVDIGKVLDKCHLIPPVLQIPAKGVEDADGPGVADVNQVIDGGTADVHLYLALLYGDKGLGPLAEGVINFHAHIRSSFPFG